MRLVARPIAPGETDSELVWLSVSIGGALLAWTWLALGLAWPICFFHAITGHACPTCGATRAAIAFLHGNVGEASRWNPLASAVYGGILLFDGYAIGALLGRTRRLRLTAIGSNAGRFFRLAAVLLVLANWIYLWRNPLI